MAEFATSIKLPQNVKHLISQIVKDSNISKSQFMRDAILEKLEDMLDIKLVEEICKNHEKSLSLSEARRELELED